MTRLLGVVCFLLTLVNFPHHCWAGNEASLSDYSLPDDQLEFTLIDSSPDDSYLAVKSDSENQLFVGGRRKLFVLRPNDDGTYQERRLVYEFPEHTWVYDIEFLGNDVFVSTVSAIYRLPNARVQQDDVKPVRLLYGIPRGHTHQCFHALAWGPNGKLFFTFGDPSWYYGDFTRPDHWAHWTFVYGPDEKEQKYNGVGAAMSINPDGTELEGYTRGLRNSCGLCFDSQWNLFTNDNDHEQFPAIYSPGRLLHITQHAYFAWPNGWLRSKTPKRMDLLETLNEDLGRYVPVLQTYYNEGALPEKYKNTLMVTRWGKRTVSYHPLEKFGATFHGPEKDLLVCENLARPVGVCVGNNGSVFVAVSHMAQNEGSPTYRSDLLMISPVHKTGDRQTPIDLTKLSVAELQQHATSDSHLRRTQAFVELIHRADTSQLSVPGSAKEAFNIFPVLLKTPTPQNVAQVRAGLSGTPEMQLAALRAIQHASVADFKIDELLPLVGSNDAAVQHAAMLAILSSPNEISPANIETIITTVAKTEDTFVRHAAATLIGRDASQDQMKSLIGHQDQGVRLLATIGLGYATCLIPEAAELPEALEVQPHRYGDPLNIELVSGKVDLRKFGKNGNYTIGDLWPLIKDQPKSIFGFDTLMSKLDDADPSVKDTAAHFLSLLHDSRSEARLKDVRAAAAKKQLEVADNREIGEVWMLGPLEDGPDGFGIRRDFETSPVDLTQTITAGGKEYKWEKQKRNHEGYGGLIDFAKIYGAKDNSSVYTFFRLQTSADNPAQLMLGPDDSVKVFHNGTEVFSKDAERGPQQYEDLVNVRLKAGSNDFLCRFHNKTGGSGSYFNYRAIGQTYFSLPDKPEGMSLAQRLAASAKGDGKVPAELLNVDWKEKIANADPERGKRLFAGEALGCAKCHSASAEDAVTGGPSLAESGKRFTLNYLVESVLLPNAQISPAFKSNLILDQDGNVTQGLIIEETKDSITVMKSDTTRVKIAKEEIEEKKETALSAMPAGLVQDISELADVVAYLLQSK